MKKLTFAVFGLALLMAACTTPGKNTAIGAGAGAVLGGVAGGVIAHNTGGDAKTGALIGAGSGLLVGGVVGNYFDKQAKELAAIATVTKTDDGIVVTLKNDILFGIGSSELTSASVQTLSDLNRVLKKYPENIIIVEGHADNTGNAASNQTLSEKRAKAVYDFLLGQQLKTYRISYRGFGDTRPVADNSIEEGRAKNRRVELNITANTELIKQNYK
ncbi:MAG: OmpA family protein [Endomicrobia bacterium]|nr:OmpA family protein [Endomicrobiia bacterium]MCL2507076.1 OmpA family protein [Endomicrobiia bacterium]